MSEKTICTVRGEVPVKKLGKCLMHEHIYFGYPGSEGNPYFERDRFISQAAKIIKRYKTLGYDTFVDATPADCCRNPVILKELSENCDVNIICTSGYYTEKDGSYSYFNARKNYYPKDDIGQEITAMISREVTQGISETGIRPGVIKVASSRDHITETEDLFIKAAAKVSQETDTMIITHTEGGSEGPEQARRLIAAGATPHRIMVGHLNDYSDLDILYDIMSQGVYVAFDRWGLYKAVPESVKKRSLSLVCALLSLGFGNRIIFSNDQCLRCLGHMTDETDEEYNQITWSTPFDMVIYYAIPELKKMGVPDRQLQAFVYDNPHRFLEGIR